MAATYAFRVAWFDCDPAGIVFCPRVLAYMNEAAHALLEQIGFSLQRLGERGVVGVPIVSLTVDYRRALKLGDHARIGAEVTGVGRSSIMLTHTVFSGEEKAIEASAVRVYAIKTEEGVASIPVHEDVRVALLGRSQERRA